MYCTRIKYTKYKLDYSKSADCTLHQRIAISANSTGLVIEIKCGLT